MSELGVLALAGLLVRWMTQLALVVVAGVALALLQVGIHHAWDAVTHIAVYRPRGT